MSVGTILHNIDISAKIILYICISAFIFSFKSFACTLHAYKGIAVGNQRSSSWFNHISVQFTLRYFQVPTRLTRTGLILKNDLELDPTNPDPDS